MIISASRRTDIPSYYFEWFLNRIREGFVYVRNPMSIHQISKVSLSPDVIDGIVFWTKNPIPLLNKLEKLKDYNFYFQFTLTSYMADIEENLPSKNDILIPAFQKLSDMIGPDRVIWRYDPIFLNEKYSIDHHVTYFDKIARKLKDHTRKCTISFIDYYRNTVNNIKNLNFIDMTDEDKHLLADAMSKIAHFYGLEIDSCAEGIDLSKYNIAHAHCIDVELLEKISGYLLKVEKDKTQRFECGCINSIDVGTYNTCKNGCKYCYANYSQKTVNSNLQCHDKNSPLITGIITENDKIIERKVFSNKLGKSEYFR